MFKIENLCAAYDRKIVFQNVSLELKKETLTALCGLNGSGKSTLLSLMSGIKNPALTISGQVLLNGQKVLGRKEKLNAKDISYLVQEETSVWNLTAKEIVEEGRFVHKKWFEDYSKSDERLVEKIMEELSILDLKDRPVSTLSGGEFQKVRIARSLAQETDYIFLDEPLSSVDISYTNKLMNLLKKLCRDGKTVCISIHDINIASQYADQIALMKKDRSGIICGEPEKMMDENFLEQAYGTRFEIFLHPVTHKKQAW